MWEAALAKLKTPSPETRRFDNWAIQHALNEKFDGAFYLVNVTGNGEYFQSGLIQWMDWSAGVGKDIAGNTYILGRIHHEYLDYLKRINASFLELIPDRLKEPNNLYKLGVDS